MQIQRVETNLILARDANGVIYDIHQVVNQARPKTAAETEPWTNGKVEWFLSTGGEAVTNDGLTFRVVGQPLVLTKVER